MPRIALLCLLVCLLTSCNDRVGPNAGGDSPAGLWDASISGITGFTGSCTAEWIMRIWAQDSGNDRSFRTMVPMTATVRCDRSSGPWSERGIQLDVRQAGNTIAFLTARADSFIVAEFSGGNVLSGRVADWYANPVRFKAARRPSPIDPNREPFLLEVQSQYGDLEVADSMMVGARVYDAYLEPIADPAVLWSSSLPSIASVRADGLVRGIKPGLGTIRGTLKNLVETLDIEVLSPAASIVFSVVPDSLIHPGGALLLAVAKDAAGQVLPGRRFHWTSSDPTVATVNPLAGTGEVTTVGPGSVTITARSSTVTASTILTVWPSTASASRQ